MDTVNGNAFQFKDLLVIPWVEMKSDSLGEKNTILNFKVYNISTKKKFNLFSENQRNFQFEVNSNKGTSYMVY